MAKKLSDAYIAAVFGLFGAHHFYLGRRKFGLIYFFTLGLFGIGFIYDLFRMKKIVRHVNTEPADDILTSDVWIICLVLGPFELPGHLKQTLLNSRELVGGVLGSGHHFYLGNRGLGLYYAMTLGSSGVGWIVDLLRTEQLVQDNDEEMTSLATAYILSVPPIGIFGPYHYYLGNTGRFLIHVCTFGLFGFGWLVDLLQMYILVSETRNIRPYSKHVNRITYCACLSPLGILGAHHFILGRRWNGLFCLFTFSFCGVYWVFDVIRLPVLLRRSADDDEHKYTDDAYTYWLPFGILGLHQFYLGRTRWGIAYLCTFGILGVGWIVDGFRIPSLVHEANQTIPGNAVNKCQCQTETHIDSDSPEEMTLDA